MTRERLFLFDTTLRDGQQTQGVQFSTDDKIQIANALDALGIDYIEGGWPGANPTDSAFFETRPQTKATFTAFGMTKRAGRSAENDEVLAAVLNAETPAVCLVGKTHDFHVDTALGITLDENVANIRESVAHLVAKGREALFDAEHFFDGYKANPGYALECLEAAHEAGARWVVLCDTNGGTLPHEVFEITRAVIAAGIPGDRLGIHTHDDTGNAVASSLAAVDAGARQVQGTLNGLDDILNRVPLRSAPYVGASAFAHKAGLHASAIVKDPSTYEHVDPSVVGNTRIVPMSNQAGQSNLLKRLSDMGLPAEKGDPALARILDAVKSRETEGYAYDSAQASFELLAREELGLAPSFFDVERYRVISERRRNAKGEIVVESEAVVTISTRDGPKTSYFKNEHAQDMQDDGPVNALWQALKSDLGPHQAAIEDMRLTDFKVRITQGGTEAVTRVIIDFADDEGRAWATVGVSANIVDASFEALVDAINWKLVQATNAAAAKSA